MTSSSSSISPQAQRFLRLTARLRRIVPEAVASPVSPAHLAVLDFLHARPGCSLHDLARGLGLRAPTVSVAVRQLENRGWVARQPHPHDRRALQLFLTPEGEAVYQQALAAHGRKFKALLAGLTPEEQATLLDLLERALRAAEAREADGPSSPRRAP